ncbi:MAG TPA: caspase family protein [Pseudonocardiaceae bacterium]|nr:caspase family protein [Pseudonocardiaceae bacterium]
MRLPDPQRSFAILIGSSQYESTDLADLPAVRNNLEDLAAVLTDPVIGWLSPERCTVIVDPPEPRTLYKALRQRAQAAEDTLLVYFAGHGQTGPRNELFLALAATELDELKVSALAFDLLRDVLADCPAANRVLILDCCFSGRAVSDMGAAQETVIGQVGVEGTYVLASAPANAVALAPAGATHTAFTGELLRLLREGIPHGPELLTYGEIYRRLLYTTTARGLPAPRQRGTDTVDLLALARNTAHDPQEAGTPDSAVPTPVFPEPALPPRRPAAGVVKEPVRPSWRPASVLLVLFGIGLLASLYFVRQQLDMNDYVVIAPVIVAYACLTAGCAQARRVWPSLLAPPAGLNAVLLTNKTTMTISLSAAVLVPVALTVVRWAPLLLHNRRKRNLPSNTKSHDTA